MKVCFVAKEAESLGIEQLSSVLKSRGHQVSLAYDPSLFDDTAFKSENFKGIFSFKNEVVSQIVRDRPDLVGFSVMSDNVKWAYEISREIKSRISVPIVFGGIHASSVPELILENRDVDFVIMGEGEYPILDLVDGLAKGRVDSGTMNLGFRRNGGVVLNPLRPLIENLDSLPFPDKDLFYDILPEIKNHYTIMSSRGCPYACTFCCNSRLKKIYNNHGKFLRRRSVDNVIGELDLAKKKYGIKDVIFDDEIFTHDTAWLKEFASAYKARIGLPSFLWVHPNTVSEEVVECLKMMNCYAVEMGVQSINPEIRKKVLHRFYSNDTLKKAISLLKRNGISCTVDNIVGLPQERMEDVENLVRFYNETRPTKIYVFYLRFYPRTEIIDIADLAPELIAGIERNMDSLPFTLRGNSLLRDRTRQINKLLVVLVLIFFLPKRIVDFIIRKKIYLHFPPVNPYNLLEIIPFIFGFIKKPFKKILPNRKSRDRYPIYMTRKLLCAAKSIFEGKKNVA
jgi:radical SAM superfamily enzyme YgiQ (UPF0313 family)